MLCEGLCSRIGGDHYSRSLAITVVCTALTLAVLRTEDSGGRRFEEGVSAGGALQGGRRIVVFECPGGTDKTSDGHRADTAHLLAAIEKAGFEPEAIFFTDMGASGILSELVSPTLSQKQKPLAFISRVDPGVYEACTMNKYFEFLRDLAASGVAAFNHPDDMEALGQKRSLLRLLGMPIFPNDTHLYDAQMGLSGLSEGLQDSLGRSGSRVIKTNRGSKGEGVLWVSVQDAEGGLSNRTSVQIVEASDTRTTVMSLGELLEQVALRYLSEVGGAVIDMPFFPRIAEGEIRLILSGRRVAHVVDKKPKGSAPQKQRCASEDCVEQPSASTFSANLGSGAKHVWHAPDEYPAVVEPFNTHLEELLARMGLRNPPPLWTADFIRTGPKDKTTFVLSEINANCVGFKSFPHLAHELVSSVAHSLQLQTL